MCAECCFFSSRRRHTRYWRDWSSDVCSSDLPYGPVKIVDTAGIDDDGIIGEKRVQKTRLEKEDADIIVRVIDGDNFTYDDMQSEEIPTLYVVNKCDKIGRASCRERV